MIVWVMFPPETDCMALFSQSRNSGLSNDIRSLDEDIMTAEGVLFEPLPVSLGVLQGCVLDSVIIYVLPARNSAITPRVSPFVRPDIPDAVHRLFEETI